MIIRDYIVEDLEAIKEIHKKSGIDYDLPDLENPLFLIKRVITDDDGKIISTCALRLIAETYL